MASFKGTFQVFNDVGVRSIEPQVRAVLKYAFAHACLTMMREYAVRVPVLSGMTRQAVISAMHSALQQFRNKGVKINFPIDIPLDTTVRKKATSDTPDESSYVRYQAPVIWEGPSGEDHILEGRVGTENSWLEAVELEGQHAFQGAQYQDVEVYNFFGSGTRGAYTFFWDISVPHWNEYGWDLMAYTTKFFDQDLRALIPPIAKHVAVAVSESLISTKSRGRMYGGSRQLAKSHPTAFDSETGLTPIWEQE